jgi:N-acetylglucosamine kinase-like BadF-type ATPase
MDLFLAVDGGQTTTKVVLADEHGRILAQTTGGPSDHTEEPGGEERLKQVVATAANNALRAVGRTSVADQEFAAACFGMTGETTIKRRVLEQLIKTPRLSVVHDSVNALVGATAGRPGLIVIAGTGSVARGMDGRGREVRFGGWGHLFGDEGSAFWIAREAIRAIAAELDGLGGPTSLTPMFLNRLGVASAYKLMEKYYSGEWSRDHMAGLAVWVNEAAVDGDRAAQTILQDAGRQLARFAVTIFSLLFTPGRTSGAEPDLARTAVISYIGGVFENRVVLSAFKEAIHHTYVDARIEPPLLSPVLGCLLMAYAAAGIEPSEAVRRGWMEAPAPTS